MNLPKLHITPKTGNEQFTSNSQSLNLSLLDFWHWSSSDLTSNALRGVLAEFIIRSAINSNDEVRVEFIAYDLHTTGGLKIEVKSAAYIQSWEQADYSKISFDIAPTKGWNNQTNEYSQSVKRQADVYIFCLLHHKDQETIDPLNLDQWTFYVVETVLLNEKLGEQKRVSLSRLKALAVQPYSYLALTEYFKPYHL